MTPADILARLRAYTPWTAPLGTARPAAVLVPFRDEPAGLSLVFTRRAAELSTHAGQVAFPGGRIDPTDPTPEAAALREAEEEIGLRPEAVELIGRLDDMLTFNGFHITPVVAQIDPQHALVPCAAEVARVFSIPVARLVDPSAWVQKEHVRDDNRYLLWHLHHDGEDLWGVTGQMVRTMVEMLWSEG